jgi:hypothetical protein
VDRFPRRRLLIGANLSVTAVLMPLLLVTGAEHLWIPRHRRCAARTGQACRPDCLLAGADVAAQTVKQLLRLPGPLVGAGLYTVTGTRIAVVAAATSFVLAATAIGTVRVSEDRPVPEPLR